MDFNIRVKVDATGKPVSARLAGEAGGVSAAQKGSQDRAADKLEKAVREFKFATLIRGVGQVAAAPGGAIPAGVSAGADIMSTVGSMRMLQGKIGAGVQWQIASELLKYVKGIANDVALLPKETAKGMVADVAARYGAFGIQLPQETITELYQKQLAVQMNMMRQRKRAQHIIGLHDIWTFSVRDTVAHGFNQIFGR